MGPISGTSVYSSKAAHVGFFHGGDTHVLVILPEDLCNWSPGFGAFVVWEETPYPLPVGCPTDGLSDIT